MNVCSCSNKSFSFSFFLSFTEDYSDAFALPISLDGISGVCLYNFLICRRPRFLLLTSDHGKRIVRVLSW